MNTDRQVEDAKRLTKFLSTPKGFLFKTKQSILQKKNTDPNTREYSRSSIIRNIDSTTAVLNGNVAEAGENRHIGSDTYEDRFDSEGFRTDKNLQRPNFAEKVKPHIDDLGGNRGKVSQKLQAARAIHLNDPDKKPVKLFDVTGEDVSYEDAALGNSPVFPFGGLDLPAPDAVTIMSKNLVEDPDNKGKLKLAPKKLQVSYGGEFGNLKQSAEELPKDFIKFRIREAVTGKWIIFPAFISGITDI